MREIVVAKIGKPAQKMSLVEVNRKLASGELTLNDRAFSEGMNDWCELADFPGVDTGGGREEKPRESQRRSASEPGRSTWDSPGEEDSWAEPTSRPGRGGKRVVTGSALMSVSTISFASVILTPVWGALMIADNWKALERFERLAASYLWFGISLSWWIGFTLAALLSPTFPNPWILVGGHALTLVIWLFASVLPQSRYLGEHGGPVTIRSALLPSVIGLICTAFSVLGIIAIAAVKKDKTVVKPTVELTKREEVAPPPPPRNEPKSTVPAVPAPVTNPVPVPAPAVVAIPEKDGRSSCLLNLRRLRLACQLLGDRRGLSGDSAIANLADTAEFMPDGKLPLCPEGGTYRCERLSDGPLCSSHGKIN